MNARSQTVKWLFGSIAATACLVPSMSFGQAVRATPYNAQLKSDPAVGNVQGIQRYGRPLKTDPDEGEGYSFHVYPTLVLPESKAPNQAGGGGALAAAGAVAPAALATAVADKTASDLPALQPFDATRGIRSYSAEISNEKMSAAAATAAMSGAPAPIKIMSKQLVQIKVRIVDVQRSDGLQLASVLDYISRDPNGNRPSFISDNNINNNKRNLSSASRFSQTGLLGVMGNDLSSGGGMLVNLTSEHINWIASFLATELNGDLVTAPEVVTLDGQNVEFLAGAKTPFELGQNVIQGQNNNIQQFFYKHVGTFISVTPNIVENEDGTPSDTVDLAIVVRLSEGGTTNLKVERNNGEVVDRGVPTETNVRAIANVVQVKNGHGVVMAGLIGERDQETIGKVPLLGDLPIAGALFRSKATVRAKTETLIFVEANILDPFVEKPEAIREKSYKDFTFGYQYVMGDISTMPLERTFGCLYSTYLPPVTCAECQYWERLHYKIARAAAQADDATK